MIAHSDSVRWLLQSGTGERGQRRPRWRSKHYDGYWCLHLVTAGSMELERGPLRQRVDGPALWTAHPGPRISYRPVDGVGWRQRWLALAGPQAAAWWANGLLPQQPQALDAAVDWEALFDAVLEIPLVPDDRWDALRKRNRCEHLLLEAQRTRAQARRPWLERAQASLATDGRVTVAAQACDMAVSSFRRHFTAATGRSPQAWLMEERLRRAQALLAESDLPIAAIAERLGHGSAEAFSKQFRQQTGFAPSAWRAAGQG